MQFHVDWIVQEVCKRIAVAFNVLRVPTMGQTADRAQKTHAGALKPHTPTGAGPRLSHRITQFAFQVCVVQLVKPINEEITGMIPTEEIVHLLHAWGRRAGFRGCGWEVVTLRVA
jgi:hypothetical protein